MFFVFNNLTLILGVGLACVAYFKTYIIYQVIAFFLEISFLTGQLLVNKFLTLYDFIVKVVTIISLFSNIVYEDSLIFLNDVSEKFLLIVNFIKKCYLVVEKGIRLAFEFELDFLNVFFKIGEFVSNVLGVFGFVFTTIKNIFSSFGSSIWLLITLGPQKILTTIYGILDFVTKSINELVDSVFFYSKKISEFIEIIYLFVFDIPLDSVYGLLIGVVLITVISLKFKDICGLIHNAVVFLYYKFLSFGYDLWTGKFLEQKYQKNNANDFAFDERLCVICAYQFKEVLIFPCKHLCVCWECSKKLMNTQHTCPICRIQIKETLKVYV